MKAIVCVDKNWGIGRKNGLLFSISEDMKFFREKTLNKIVIMGSNTLKSFPNGKPLKNRINVVLYPGGEKREDCIIVQSMDEMKKVISKFDEDVFVIGGAMFYKTMLPYCEEVFVTKVDADGNAEVFYENLDELDNWSMVYEGETLESNGLKFKFTTYKNSSPEKFA